MVLRYILRVLNLTKPSGAREPCGPHECRRELAGSPLSGTKLTPHERNSLGEWLGRYVYVLVDPFDGMPFYVGRGVGARVAQHGADAAKWIAAEQGPAGPKVSRIRGIRAKGGEPEIFIVRRRIGSQKECNAIEAALIDVFLTFPVRPGKVPTPLTSGAQLTNAVRGEGIDFGLESLALLIQDLTAPPLQTTVPLLIIALGNWTDSVETMPDGKVRPGYGWKAEWAYEPDLDQLCESVTCWWSGLNETNVAARNVRHVVATYRSITRGLFEIVDGSWEYRDDGGSRRRGGFAVRPIADGRLWSEVVGPKGHRLPDKQRGDQSAYRYWPYRDQVG